MSIQKSSELSAARVVARATVERTTNGENTRQPREMSDTKRNEYVNSSGSTHHCLEF